MCKHHQFRAEFDEKGGGSGKEFPLFPQTGMVTNRNCSQFFSEDSGEKPLPYIHSAKNSETKNSSLNGSPLTANSRLLGSWILESRKEQVSFHKFSELSMFQTSGKVWKQPFFLATTIHYVPWQMKQTYRILVWSWWWMVDAALSGRCRHRESKCKGKTRTFLLNSNWKIFVSSPSSSSKSTRAEHQSWTKENVNSLSQGV